MFRSTLVAQLLTFVLDAQGADVASVMALFPEEFTPRTQRSESPPRAGFPWTDASQELTDSLMFLAQRNLVRITSEGRVVLPDAIGDTSALSDRLSLDEREDGFGCVPLFDWTGDGLGLQGHANAHDFDAPRLEG